MVAVADHDVTDPVCCWKWHFKTKGGVALGQHPRIDRAMRLMAGVAALAQSLVLEDKRPALHGVTLETGFVCARQFGAAALDCGTFVRVMAIRTAHFPFQHRVVVRQGELRPHIEMALETGLRRSARVDDRARATTAFHVQTPRAVARLAADLLRVVSFRLQARMGRGMKSRVFLVTRFAFPVRRSRAGDTRGVTSVRVVLQEIK